MLSIVIPIFNGKDYTRSCLNSLFNLIKEGDQYPYRVILVDNGSTDGSNDLLGEFSGLPIRYLRNEKNEGFAVAVNQGIKLALDMGSEEVLVLNNDTLIIPETVLSLREQLYKLPDAGLVGPVSNYAGGIQGINIKDCKPENYVKISNAVYEKNKGKVAEAGVVTGLCMMIKREVIEKVGYFDERFKPGMFEDNDICISGETKIPLLDGTTKTIKELSEQKDWKDTWTYSLDENKNIVAGKVNKAWKTGSKPVLKITLDNNESFKCTPDHRIMLKDGSYKEAKDLKPNNSLMPLYRRYDTIGAKRLYEQVYNLKEGCYFFTHRLIAKNVFGDVGDNLTHHINFNTLDNRPSNLRLMTAKEHYHLHAEPIRKFITSPEGIVLRERNAKDPVRRAKVRLTWLGKPKTEENKKKRLKTYYKRKAEGKYVEVHKKISNLRKADGRIKKCQEGYALYLLKRTPEQLYEEMRKRYLTQLKKGRVFTDETLKKYNLVLNHKIIKIEVCGIEDVYDMEIEKYHNFAIGFNDKSGIFVHNCLRIRNAGYKCYVSYQDFVYHYGSKTFGNVVKGRLSFLLNQARFAKKWTEIYKIGEKKKVVGILRVKNGEPYIEETLTRSSEYCDEIVVLDDGSTDNTFKICKKFSKVVKLEKNNEKSLDEARDRNKLLQWAKERKADWCFIIDHDEVPEDRLTYNHMQKLCNPVNPEIEGYIFKIEHFWNDEQHVRSDGLWGGFQQCRLFKLKPFHKIIGTGGANYHCGNHPAIPSHNLKHTHLRIKHYGNMDSKVRKKKYEWYTKNDSVKDVGSILGGWKDYYKKIYKKRDFSNEDYYRHIIDETGLKLSKWEENNEISLCMIVKNEENYLSRCLDSVKGLVSEIIIVDTGSTDRTIEIARRYTDKIYGIKWENDFSKARNFSLEKATQKWILRLDADEYLIPQTVEEIARYSVNGNADAVIFPIINFQQDPTKFEKPDWILSETCRFFRNDKRIRYSGLVHEEIDASLKEMIKIQLVRIVKAVSAIQHFGYLRDKDLLKEKFEYYANLAFKQIEEDPINPRPYFNLAVHYFHAGDVDKAEEYYKKVVELDPKHYLAWSDLGIIYYKRLFKDMKFRFEEVLKYFEKAQENMPPNTSKIHQDKIAKHIATVENYIKKGEK